MFTHPSTAALEPSARSPTAPPQSLDAARLSRVPAALSRKSRRASPRTPLVAALLLTLVPAVVTRAALYDFKIGVRVLSSGMLNINNGDLGVLRFVADSTDLVPGFPEAARFLTTGPSVTFPGRTITSGQSGELSLALTFGPWQNLSYRSYSPNPLEPDSLNVDFGVTIPGGTFTSDELPQTLPLDRALSNRFSLFRIWNDDLIGRLETYDVSLVPEPGGTFAIIGALLVLRRKTPAH